MVTTRRLDGALTHNGRRLVPVGLFTPREAAACLSAALGAHRDEAAEHLHALVEDLGFLPLALSQAAAYMADRGLDCAAYRRRFTDRRRTLAEIFPEAGALPDDQRGTLATTWSLSIEPADQLAPVGLARPLLELAGMLDANGIPAAVLSSPPALAHLASRRARTAPAPAAGDAGEAAVDPETAGDALHCLRRLNPVELAADAAGGVVRLWQIGRADRTGGEFALATQAPAMPSPRDHVKPGLVPASLDFTVGKDWEPESWYYAQTEPGVWKVHFPLAKALDGTAYLTVSSSTQGKPPTVTVNGTAAAIVGSLPNGGDSGISRQADRSAVRVLSVLTFPASLLTVGDNTVNSPTATASRSRPPTRRPAASAGTPSSLRWTRRRPPGRPG